MSRYCWPFAMGIVVALGAVPAPAQDYTAGKTPPQLFASDCAACHKSAQGLGRGKDASSLTSFLREHYTTKPASAGALAAYLTSVAGGSGAVRRPATAEEPRPAAKPKPPAEGAAKLEEEKAPKHKPRAASEETKPEGGRAAAKPPAGEEGKPPEGVPARPRAARVSPAAESGAAEGEPAPARRPRAARTTEQPKPTTVEAEAPARRPRVATPTGEPRPAGARVREAEPGAEGAKPVARTPGARVREKPMTPAERLKSYSNAGENAKATEESQGEPKTNARSRLEDYATSGADADAVGHSASAERGQDGKPAKMRKRGNRAEAPQGEPAAAPTPAPAAASPTAPAAGAAPDAPNPAPPAADEKK